MIGVYPTIKTPIRVYFTQGYYFSVSFITIVVGRLIPPAMIMLNWQLNIVWLRQMR